MAAQQQAPLEEEAVADGEVSHSVIWTLETAGISRADIQKLIDAGFNTVSRHCFPTQWTLASPSPDVLVQAESVAYATNASLLKVKGLGDAKVAKIKDAAAKLVPMGFTTAAEYHKTRQEIIQVRFQPGNHVSCNFQAATVSAHLIFAPPLPRYTRGARNSINCCTVVLRRDQSQNCSASSGQVSFFSSALHYFAAYNVVDVVDRQISAMSSALCSLPAPTRARRCRGQGAVY